MNLRSMRIAAGIVWSAAGLLLVASLVGLLAWGVIATQHASQSRDSQIATLIKTVREDNHDAARDRRTAAANQKALLDYTAALASRQDALLDYLRAHAIRLPAQLVTALPRPRIVVHPRHRSTHVRRHRAGRSSRTGTTAHRAPGHSGHRHHRRHR